MVRCRTPHWILMVILITDKCLIALTRAVEGSSTTTETMSRVIIGTLSLRRISTLIIMALVREVVVANGQIKATLSGASLTKMAFMAIHSMADMREVRNQDATKTLGLINGVVLMMLARMASILIRVMKRAIRCGKLTSSLMVDQEEETTLRTS